MDTTRVSSLTCQKPNKKKDVEKILGLIKWIRKIIKYCTLKTEFLTNKLKSSKRFEWTTSDATQLNALFNEIKRRPLLNFLSFSEPFELYTDASDSAAGGVVM